MKEILGILLGLTVGSSAFAAADMCKHQDNIEKLSAMVDDEFNSFVSSGKKIDQILISKKYRRIYLLQNQKVIRTYRVAFGDPRGPKRFQGDNKTPEGLYYITKKNPDSGYYLSLEISYPNQKDIEYAHRFGKSAGGDIMIHGLPTNPYLHRKFALQHPLDWTRGCVAVNDTQIREIYNVTAVETPITICPLK